MLNDLRVSERHAPRPDSEDRWRPGETRYRYFLGSSGRRFKSCQPDTVSPATRRPC